jgi:hypothetical protein
MAVNFDGEGFRAATACQYARSIAWYADGRLQRRMGSMHLPNAVTFVGEGGTDTFAVAEGPQVSHHIAETTPPPHPPASH